MSWSLVFTLGILVFLQFRDLLTWARGTLSPGLGPHPLTWARAMPSHLGLKGFAPLSTHSAWKVVLRSGYNEATPPRPVPAHRAKARFCWRHKGASLSDTQLLSGLRKVLGCELLG